MTKEILFTKQVVGVSRIGVGCFISACRKTGFDSTKLQVTTCQRKTQLLHKSRLRTLSENDSSRDFPCPGPPGLHLRQVLHRIISDISRCPARASGGGHGQVGEYRLQTVGEYCLFFEAALHLTQYNPQLAPAGTLGLFDGRFAIKLCYN